MRKISGYEMYYTKFNNFHFDRYYNSYEIWVSNLYQLKCCIQVRSLGGGRVLGYCHVNDLEKFCRSLDTLFTFCN